MPDLTQDNADRMPLLEDGRRLKCLRMTRCWSCLGEYATQAECSDGSVIKLNDRCRLCDKAPEDQFKVLGP